MRAAELAVAADLDVAVALAGRSAMLSPRQDGYGVVFDEQSEDQDLAVIADLTCALRIPLFRVGALFR